MTQLDFALEARRRGSNKAKLLAALSDGKWHNNRELNDICFRYGARILEIRKSGRVVHSAPGLGGRWSYLLDATGVLKFPGTCIGPCCNPKLENQ